MLAEKRIELEARNAVANCLRRWSIELSRDLLGTWVVDVEFGRIGASGRSLRHVLSTTRRRRPLWTVACDAVPQHLRGSALRIGAFALLSRRASF